MLCLQVSAISHSWMSIHSFFFFFFISSPWVLKLDVEMMRVLPTLLWCHLITDPVQHAKLVGPSLLVPSETSSTETYLQISDLSTQQRNWHRHLLGKRADLDSELLSFPVWRSYYMHSAWYRTTPGQEAPSWEGLDACLRWVCGHHGSLAQSAFPVVFFFSTTTGLVPT